MTSIFYFTGFILSVVLLSGLVRYPKMMALRKNYNISNDKNAKLDSIIRKEDRPAYIYMITYAFAVLFFLSWASIGLLSNNWVAFLCILVGYLVLSKVFNFLTGKGVNILKTILFMSLTLVVSASCLFMAINHFYLKYDLEPIIKTFFGIS